MKKAIGYTRISTKDQSNFSLDGQQQHIQDYATKHEIEILSFFKDDGESAKNFDRPNWKLLEQFVKEHHRNIDMLIVAKFDRFSRNLREALNMIDSLESKYGIIVVSVFEHIGLHPKNPHYFEYRTHSLLSANTELLRIRERTKMGIRQANITGQWVNKPPYGYQKVKTDTGKRTLEINVAKAMTIQSIFQLFVQGNSYKEIGLYMKREGFAQRHKSFIQRILKNHAYAGLIKVSEFYDEPEKLITGLHPAIIEVGTFWKVQQMMQPRLMVKYSINDNFPLRGVLHCHPCNKLLTAAFSKGKSKRIGYYFCNVDRKYNFNSNRVHTLFDALLQELSLPVNYINYLEETSRQVLEEKLEHRDLHIVEKRKELAAIDEQISSLQRAYIRDKVFTPADYKKMYTELENEKQVIQIFISDITTPLDKVWTTYNKELYRLTDVKKVYDLADTNQKQTFIRIVFERDLRYWEGCFRTQFLLPVFSLKAASLQEKKLLVIEQPEGNFIGNQGFVPPKVSKSNPLHELITLFSNIKIA